MQTDISWMQLIKLQPCKLINQILLFKKKMFEQLLARQTNGS